MQQLTVLLVYFPDSVHLTLITLTLPIKLKILTG